MKSINLYINTENIESIVKEYKEAGFDKITIIRRYDPYNKEELRDVKDYYLEVNEVQKKYDNVFFGLEISVRNDIDSLNRVNTIIESYPYDMVIGLPDPLMKISSEKIIRTEDISFIYDVLNIVKSNRYIGIYSHFDYIYYYSNFVPEDKYEEYMNVVDEIMTILVEKNKGICINERRANHHYFSLPNVELLESYKEHGGKIVCSKSDLKVPKEKVNQIYSLFEYCGFDEVATYKDRHLNFEENNRRKVMYMGTYQFKNNKSVLTYKGNLKGSFNLYKDLLSEELFRVDLKDVSRYESSNDVIYEDSNINNVDVFEQNYNKKRKLLLNRKDQK